ncbi:MAG: hypothetical protein WBM44_07210 [Waterburya sp.]
MFVPRRATYQLLRQTRQAAPLVIRLPKAKTAIAKKYHYEEWREGDRPIKKSRYIPKRLVPKVERINQEKVAVEEILSCFEEEE